MSRTPGEAPIILVVDDSLMERAFLRRVLEPAGFKVIEAVDGLDGLKKLTGEVACVVCDVNMPRMSGVEFLRVASGTVRPLPPVLMVTVEGGRLVPRRRAREMGVVGWVVKPFNPELLLAAVQRSIDEAHHAPTRSVAAAY